jgi:hypothetical protein
MTLINSNTITCNRCQNPDVAFAFTGKAGEARRAAKKLGWDRYSTSNGHFVQDFCPSCVRFCKTRFIKREIRKTSRFAPRTAKHIEWIAITPNGEIILYVAERHVSAATLGRLGWSTTQADDIPAWMEQQDEIATGAARNFGFPVGAMHEWIWEK